jgi:hypothetical protein
LAVVFAVCGVAVAAPDPPGLARDDGSGWSRAAERDGIVLERHAVAGSSYFAYRARFDVALPPARAADEIWRALRDGDMDSLKHREILRASGDELLIYDQIRTPVVSDRDYTIRVRRISDGSTTQFRCESANELGPPPAKNHVRIPFIRAGWMTAPGDGGGTRVTYYAFSEPGGSVPAFLVRGAQQNRSLADVTRMRERLRRASP